MPNCASLTGWRKDLAVDIGQAIREVRSSHGLTQAELAKTIGIGTTYLTKIERGERIATTETLYKISHELKAGWFDL